MRFRRSLFPCCLAAALAGSVRAALPTKPTINLAIAKKIVASAEAAAAQRHWPMVILVIDDGGNPILLERMDGAQLGSIKVAEAKAQTALRFKRPSKAYQDLVAAGHPILLTVPGVIAIDGGIPLMVKGTPVGAIGVSGMQPNQDGAIAQAGADEFEQLAK